MMPRCLLLLCLLLAAWPLHAVEPLNGAAMLDAIDQRAAVAVAGYDPNDGVTTAGELSSLYFEQFEPLELDLGRRAPALKIELEMRFGALTSSALRGVAKADLERAAQRLSQSLDKARELYAAGSEASGGWNALLQSLLILLREGLEAILILSALSAWLRRSGNTRHLRALNAGALVALAAALVTAWALTLITRASGLLREGIEGVTMLIAAIVLLYVGGWLFARREGQRWQAALHQQLAAATDRGGGFWIALAGFLAVYREGAEVALFYQALFASQSGQEGWIWAGVGLALMALVAIHFVIRTASLRLPLKPFFTATALLMFALAFNFAGRGLISLQALGWIRATPLEFLPELPRLGFSGTLEGAVLQGAVVLLPLLWGLWRFWRRGASA